jgi:hypothetical protein
MLAQTISPKVLNVQPLENYQLKLTFDNAEIRIFDVTPYLEKGIFTELKDPNYFRQVKLFFGGIQWPNEQDFSRDTLYLLSQPESSTESQPRAAFGEMQNSGQILGDIISPSQQLTPPDETEFRAFVQSLPRPRTPTSLQIIEDRGPW